ncbi:amidohydrolase family protein [Uliginosibacterium gangwonense]|uniref:amidohydrolase family protein n=1 Tax=Uliginosibacterium gangwonense TaxID=392736 RepID=UPI0003672BBB|nr:amidohydrolase family protein [Uliginosibacterium gangwonense]
MPSQSNPKIRGVDTHAHIFHRGLTLAKQRRYAPAYDATPEDYLAQLEANGISHGVLVQPSFLGTNNDYLLDALQRFPDQLRGIVVVTPDISDEELERMAAAGAVGIRLNLFGMPLPDLRNQTWQALLKKLAARNWLVEIQRQAHDLPELVPDLLDAGLRVIIDHIGLPDPTLGEKDPGFQYLLTLAHSKQVWVKASAPYRCATSKKTIDQWMAALRRSFGSEYMLWGSDWPHTCYEQLTAYPDNKNRLDTWFPDPDEKEIVLVSTPARLFGFDPTSP